MKEILAELLVQMKAFRDEMEERYKIECEKLNEVMERRDFYLVRFQRSCDSIKSLTQMIETLNTEGGEQ